MFHYEYTPSEETALMQALELQDVAKAKSLILSGADVNYKINQKGWNALHYSSQKGLLEIVECILHKHIKGKKFNINARNNYGQTALSLAASKGHKDIVELFLKYHADINLYVNTNHTEIFPFSWTLLHEASYRGWMKVVQAILDKSDLDVQTEGGLTALMVAVMMNRQDIAMVLLLSGAGVGAVEVVDNRTVLHLAINNRWLGVVEMILERQPNLEVENCYGQTALILAASMRYKEIVKLLLESGASLECRDTGGWTSLHYASSSGWTEIVKHMVLESKCNINDIVESGETALMMAVECNEEEVAELLLNHGADVHIKNVMDETVFTKAIMYETSVNFISLLVEKEAYINSMDYELICNNSVLKEQVLKNRDICVQSVVNEYNIVRLPAVKDLSGSYNIVLPSIKNFQINGGNVLREIGKMVDHEIETKSICNVMKVRPLVLQMMAVRSLLDYPYCQ